MILESSRKEWKRCYNGSVFYKLQVDNSELRVEIGRARVYVDFETPHRSEHVIYQRDSGDIETIIETHKKTDVGIISTKQEGQEPYNILGNKDMFLAVKGFARKDKKLVDLVFEFIQQEF